MSAVVLTDARHPVCDLIDPQKNDESIESETPNWSASAISRVTARSETLCRALLALLFSRGKPWPYEAIGNDFCFDAASLMQVLRDLGKPAQEGTETIALENPDPNYESMRKYCCSLWYIRAQLAPFRSHQSLNGIPLPHDEDGQRALLRARRQRTCQRIPPLDTIVDADKNGPAFVWHRVFSDASPFECIDVAITAFVFRWREVLKNELECIFWDWSGASDTHIPSPQISGFKQDALRTKRKQLLVQVKGLIRQGLGKAKLLSKVQRRLKKLGLLDDEDSEAKNRRQSSSGEEPEESVYGYLTRLEAALRGYETSPDKIRNSRLESKRPEIFSNGEGKEQEPKEVGGVYDCNTSQPVTQSEVVTTSATWRTKNELNLGTRFVNWVSERTSHPDRESGDSALEGFLSELDNSVIRLQDETVDEYLIKRDEEREKWPEAIGLRPEAIPTDWAWNENVA